MSIPTGPFPAPIDFTDLLVGMHVRGTMVFPDLDESAVFELWVAGFNPSGEATSRAGFVMANPATWDETGRTLTYELLEAFTGNPHEPATGSVVQAADGTIYQRATDADPTASVWHATNSTTATTWTEITAGGPVTVILDGGAQ